MNRLIYILLLFPALTAFSPLPTPTEKGISAFSAGKYDDAQDNFEQAAKDNPNKAEAHINLGDALYKRGQYNKAAQEYEQAAKLDPKMPEAWYNMGDALYKMGAYEKALDAFQKAQSIKHEPDTKHNIDVTMEKVKKEQERKNSLQSNRGNQGKQSNQDKRGQQGNENRGGSQSGNAGQTAQNNQGNQSGPSDSDISKMLAKQREEEKNLRNYFKPGKKDPMSDRETQIEQMLRAMGAPVPAARAPKPGAPYIEKDW